jgi:hypothetical protein
MLGADVVSVAQGGRDPAPGAVPIEEQPHSVSVAAAARDPLATRRSYHDSYTVSAVRAPPRPPSTRAFQAVNSRVMAARANGRIGAAHRASLVMPEPGTRRLPGAVRCASSLAVTGQLVQNRCFALSSAQVTDSK